jgi:hypothetical protein
VQTGVSGLRVVLDPSPDSSTGTTDPALLMYSGEAHEQRPGSVSANTWSYVGTDQGTVLAVKAPDVAGKRQPQLLLFGDAIDSTTGLPTGDRNWFRLEADSDQLGKGYADITGNAGVDGTPNSASISLQTRDDSTAGAGFTDVVINKTGLTVSGTNGTITTPLVTNGTAWIDVIFRTGWTHFDTTAWQKTQYRMLPDGRVQLRGLFKPTAGGVNGTAFDIPVGYRPYTGTGGRPQIYALGCQSNVGATLFVYTDGHVDVAQATATTQWLSCFAEWDTRG